MAGVTAHITSADIVDTARQKGEVGNFIGVKQIIDPAGATGATTVSVSGLEITVKLKNTSGTTITATNAEILAALSGSAAVQGLVTVVQGTAGTGATGVAFTGAGGVFVRGASGAESGSTVTYDDLAGATGDGWLKQSGNGLDLFTKVRGENSNYPGTEERQAAVAATGATAGVLAAGRTELRAARKGFASPVGL